MGDRGTVSALYPIYYLLSPPAKAVGGTGNLVSYESAMGFGVYNPTFLKGLEGL
jgi:hypothetical protein